QVGDPAPAASEAARAPFAHEQSSLPGDELLDFLALGRRHLAEVLVTQDLAGAPGPHEPGGERLAVLPSPSIPCGIAGCSGRGWRVEARALQPAALSHGSQVQARLSFGGLAPEDFEGFVEEADLLAPAHEEAPRGVVEIAPPPDRDVLQRAGE